MRRLSNQYKAGITDEIKQRRKDVGRPLGNAVETTRKPLRCLTHSVESVAILHGRD